MDATTFRVVDTLANAWAAPISIRELANMVRKEHGTAHYANVYNKVKELERMDIVKLQPIGKSVAVSLNFSSRTVDMLTGVEMERKFRLLAKRQALQPLLDDISSAFAGSLNAVSSISIIDGERNLALRRVELLFLLAEAKDKTIASATESEIHTLLHELQRKRGIKMDYLIVRQGQLGGLLNERCANPLKTMLNAHIAFFHPDELWIAVKKAAEFGVVVWGGKAVDPAGVSEGDMAYNLDRLGYSELGSKIGKGEDVRVEYIAASIMIGGTARRLEAIPILLAKNRPDYSMLFFLCKKYNVVEKLLACTKALVKARKDPEAGKLVAVLESIGVRPSRFDTAAAIGKMRMYGAD